MIVSVTVTRMTQGAADAHAPFSTPSETQGVPSKASSITSPAGVTCLNGEHLTHPLDGLKLK